MRKLLLVFITVLLAGCAGFGGYGIQAGAPRDAVISQMGQQKTKRELRDDLQQLRKSLVMSCPARSAKTMIAQLSG